MMPEQVWCQHIGPRLGETNGWWFRDSGGATYVSDDWKGCPICLALRPKPKPYWCIHIHWADGTHWIDHEGMTIIYSERWKFCRWCGIEKPKEQQAEGFKTNFVIHGTSCPKIPHIHTGGYLHETNDDTPYDVDGIKYCGRCHKHLD